MESMARSNNPLSGCLESIFASGFWTLWWQPAASRRADASARTEIDLRNIATSERMNSHSLQCRFAGQLQQLLRVFPRTTMAKNCVAGHQDLRSGTHNFRDRFRADSAVD